MPKLSIFALCEKVIIDKEDRASLISLFTTLSAKILPTNEVIPSNAVAPKEWCAYALWDTQPEDVGKEYRQVLQLLYPNGEPFGPPIGINFLALSEKAHQHIVANGMGFPIGQEGAYTMKMWLEHQGVTVFEPAPIIVNVNHVRLTEMPKNFVSFP